MTVSELIGQLLQHPQSDEVHVTTDTAQVDTAEGQIRVDFGYIRPATRTWRVASCDRQYVIID